MICQEVAEDVSFAAEVHIITAVSYKIDIVLIA